MDFTRQLDIISPERLQTPITVIGVGGIGSPTTIVLAKMGCANITAYDPDVVEEHNLPNQIYRLSDVDQPKVVALQKICQDFSGTKITPRQEEVNGQRLSGIVISAVDSMESRRIIWEKSIRNRPEVLWYIDARMGYIDKELGGDGEVGEFYTVRPLNLNDQQSYEATLFSDEQAVPVPCTAAAVIYNVFWIAALIGNQVKKLIKGEEYFKEIKFGLKGMVLIVS